MATSGLPVFQVEQIVEGTEGHIGIAYLRNRTLPIGVLLKNGLDLFTSTCSRELFQLADDDGSVVAVKEVPHDLKLTPDRIKTFEPLGPAYQIPQDNFEYLGSDWNSLTPNQQLMAYQQISFKGKEALGLLFDNMVPHKIEKDLQVGTATAPTLHFFRAKTPFTFVYSHPLLALFMELNNTRRATTPLMDKLRIILKNVQPGHRGALSDGENVFETAIRALPHQLTNLYDSIISDFELEPDHSLSERARDGYMKTFDAPWATSYSTAVRCVRKVQKGDKHDFEIVQEGGKPQIHDLVLYDHSSLLSPSNAANQNYNMVFAKEYPRYDSSSNLVIASPFNRLAKTSTPKEYLNPIFTTAAHRWTAEKINIADLRQEISVSSTQEWKISKMFESLAPPGRLDLMKPDVAGCDYYAEGVIFEVRHAGISRVWTIDRKTILYDKQDPTLGKIDLKTLAMNVANGNFPFIDANGELQWDISQPSEIKKLAILRSCHEEAYVQDTHLGCSQAQLGAYLVNSLLFTPKVTVFAHPKTDAAQTMDELKGTYRIYNLPDISYKKGPDLFDGITEHVNERASGSLADQSDEVLNLMMQEIEGYSTIGAGHDPTSDELYAILTRVISHPMLVLSEPPESFVPEANTNFHTPLGYGLSEFVNRRRKNFNPTDPKNKVTELASKPIKPGLKGDWSSNLYLNGKIKNKNHPVFLPNAMPLVDLSSLAVREDTGPKYLTEAPAPPKSAELDDDQIEFLRSVGFSRELNKKPKGTLEIVSELVTLES